MIQITELAKKRILALKQDQEERQEKKVEGLRLVVKGMAPNVEYTLAFVEEGKKDVGDAVVVSDGVKIFMESRHASFLEDVKIDFINTLNQNGFKVENPKVVMPEPQAPHTSATEHVGLTRDCEAVQIPAGYKVTLVKGTKAIITQSLGGTYTLHVPSFGGLFRVSGKDADAIGKEVEAGPQAGTMAQAEGTIGLEELEKQVWDQLKTCYDPEIPIDIVNLGLVYDMRISALPNGARKVDVKMTLTAQGCGMGRSIAADAQDKLLRLPGVGAANVDIVWNPPWNRDMISPDGKAQLDIK